MSLARSLSRTALRIRTERALTAACYTSAAAGCLALISGRALVFSIAGAAALLAFARPLARAYVARRLDDACAMEGRVTAAVELAKIPLRSPFMDAALRDAERSVQRGDPARAAPLSMTRLVALAALGACWLLRNEAPPRAAPPPGPVQALAPALSPHERELARANTSSSRVRELLTRLGTLSREQALAELRALENESVASGPSSSLPIVADGTLDAQPGKNQRLTDAIAGPRVTPAARAQLQQALTHARALDEQRRAAQSSSVTAPEDRKLDALHRPNEPKLSRAGGEQTPRESRDHHAQLEAARRERQELAQLREQLTRTPTNQQALARFERVAGGGNERDPGDHAKGERRIGGRYFDQQLRGSQGEGPSRSQVIAGASQAGFASAPYRRVYDDYREHTEQVLEREQVPAGERFYIRRYFQLVQPRQVEDR